MVIKHEYRNTKFSTGHLMVETISNDKNSNYLNKMLWEFEHWDFVFVSYFSTGHLAVVLRISDFVTLLIERKS